MGDNQVEQPRNQVDASRDLADQSEARVETKTQVKNDAKTVHQEKELAQSEWESQTVGSHQAQQANERIDGDGEEKDELNENEMGAPVGTKRIPLKEATKYKSMVINTCIMFYVHVYIDLKSSM